MISDCPPLKSRRIGPLVPQFLHATTRYHSPGSQTCKGIGGTPSIKLVGLSGMEQNLWARVYKTSHHGKEKRSGNASPQRRRPSRATEIPPFGTCILPSRVGPQKAGRCHLLSPHTLGKRLISHLFCKGRDEERMERWDFSAFDPEPQLMVVASGVVI